MILMMLSRAKYLIFNTTLIACLLTAFSVGPARADSTIALDSRDLPVVWIASAQGRPTLILLPTIHWLPFNDPRIDARLSRLVDMVDAVVLELSTADLTAQRSVLIRHALYPAGDNLTNHINLITPAELAGCALREQRPLAQFFEFKPWLAATSIEKHRVELRRTAAGIVTAERPVFAGIDDRLNALAGRTQKPLIGLETPEEAFALLDSLPKSGQDAWLRDACDGENGQTPSEISVVDVERAWLSDNFVSVERLIGNMPGERPELRSLNDYLIHAGNELFIRTIEKDGYFHARGPILVAVGAAHFFGKNSFLDLLAADGYQIQVPTRSANQRLP
ncbi:TraB/GumN family protein [Paraburkholderia sp. C35]|uniref:TraB/GumN family protein n=1 Tax=Paraburkholderia sp. C35 TaxID=2126993 RepID=UPI000D698B81|nr:TraB/GumN family protein [Paraburkholderia sp. C35]